MLSFVFYKHFTQIGVKIWLKMATWWYKIRLFSVQESNIKNLFGKDFTYTSSFKIKKNDLNILKRLKLVPFFLRKILVLRKTINKFKNAFLLFKHEENSKEDIFVILLHWTFSVMLWMISIHSIYKRSWLLALLYQLARLYLWKMRVFNLLNITNIAFNPFNWMKSIELSFLHICVVFLLS